MADSPHEFIAEELWLLVAIVTLPLAGLASLAGLGASAGAIAVVGWFLLTPLLLFWGEEIANLVANPPVGNESGEHSAERDPLEILKERYARGELDEDEFERRLDRLLELDYVTVSDTARADEIEAANELEREYDR